MRIIDLGQINVSQFAPTQQSQKEFEEIAAAAQFFHEVRMAMFGCNSEASKKEADQFFNKIVAKATSLTDHVKEGQAKQQNVTLYHLKPGNHVLYMMTKEKITTEMQQIFGPKAQVNVDEGYCLCHGNKDRIYLTWDGANHEDIFIKK